MYDIPGEMYARIRAEECLLHELVERNNFLCTSAEPECQLRIGALAITNEYITF